MESYTILHHIVTEILSIFVIELFTIKFIQRYAVGQKCRVNCMIFFLSKIPSKTKFV